jgi:kynurenine formamidase
VTRRDSGSPQGIAAALASVCIAACSARQVPPAPAPRPGDLSAFRLVDLSHTYDESTLYWPTSPSRFESETLADGYTPGGFYYRAKRFSTPEHGGTHIDAPVHFAEEGWSLDEIPLARLIGPAVVIDVSEAAMRDADYVLGRADVEAWEAEHGPIPEGSIVLLRTGWSRFWPDEGAYFGRPEGGELLDLHFPSYGAEAARFLIEQRRVALLGVDTASIDHGPSADFPVHRIAGGANVPGLENLTGLEQLPAVGSLVIAAPIRTVGGSGAPVRAVALVPQ